MLAGCAGSKIDLLGTNWQATTLYSLSVLENVSPTLVLDADNKISGSDGCNRYSGIYTINGDELTLTPQTSTMMACPDKVMTQANLFLKALSETTKYEIKGGQLNLIDKDGNRIATLTPTAYASLEDTPWVVESYNNGKQATAGVIKDTQITAVFKKDGTLSGNSGCNEYNSTYKTDGNTITIGAVATTRMACAEDVMNQEQLYLAALQGATTYQLGENLLDLLGSDNALLVRFKVASPE